MESSQAELHWPTFDIKSIIEILTNLGLESKLTPKDFKNPSMEMMIKIYKMFLETCLSVSAQVIDMEPADAVLYFEQDILKNQLDSFKFLQFYALVQYFFELCGIPQRDFNDIFHPTRKVFIKNISTMINFSRFEFDELADFSAVQEQNKAYIEECQKLKRENDEMRNTVQFLEAKKQTEKEPIENAKKRIGVLKDKLAAIREQRKKIGANRDLVQKEEDSLNSEMNQFKTRQQEIQKKMLLYDKLLVRSPERLKKDLEKNEARIVELKKHVEAKRQEKENLKCDLFEREKFVENFKQVKENVDTFYNNDVKKTNEKLKETEVLKESITSLKFDIQQIGSSIQTLQAEKDKINMDIQRESQTIEKEMMQLKEKDDFFKQKIKEEMQRIEDLKSKQATTLEQRETFIKKSQLTHNEALDVFMQFKKNEEMSKKVCDIKLNTLTNMDKEARRALEKPNQVQAKLFHFVKQL